MDKRFFFIVLALLLTPLALTAAPYDALLPLLVDLSGWEGGEAAGADMSATGMRAVSAAREYTRGEDQTLSAVIMVGMMVQGAWTEEYVEGFKAEDSETRVQVQKINGFLVHTGVEKGEDSGGVLVLLQEATAKPGSGAVFALGFEGIKLEEALKLAKLFNWKQMKAAVEKL